MMMSTLFDAGLLKFQRRDEWLLSAVKGEPGMRIAGTREGFFFFCNLTDGRLMKSSHGCAQEKSSLVLLAPFGSYCSTTEIHICNIVYWSSLYRAATAGICPSAITSFTLKPPLITSLLR